MLPDKIHPPKPHGPVVAQPQSGYMPAPRRAWGAVTHTPPTPPPARKVTVRLVRPGPLPFAAKPTPRPKTVTVGRRIGWSLAIMCLAETVVALAAIAGDNYAVGIVATASMATCGILLVLAECIGLARGVDQ